jgi:hypothetical protein
MNRYKSAATFGRKLREYGFRITTERCEACRKRGVLRKEPDETFCPRCTFGRTTPETREHLGLGYIPAKDWDER